MAEKRRAQRIKVDLKLNVSSLFRQNNIEISNVNSPIEVLDVSKSGIGFISKSVLPLDFYFNAALQLGLDNGILYCVVRIIRCNPLSKDEYSYGCEFVGMAPILDYIFDDLADYTEKEL